MADYKVIFRLDGPSKKIIGHVVDAAGDEVDAWGSIVLELTPAVGSPVASPSGTMGEAVSLMEMKGKNASGATAYVMIPRTPSYTAKFGTSEPDFQAGGGEGGPLLHYAKANSYSPGQRVVVYPTDELVTTGILDEETEQLVKAPAGNYTCQRAVSPVPIDPEADPIVYRYNAPKWPTETPDDLDAANTYWWLDSLYVAVATQCVDGENPSIYVNKQPIPEQP
jgi:hypothetical protein